MTPGDAVEIPDSIQLNPDGGLARFLIGYFGFWQTLHILVNLRALVRFRRGDDTFPANPPADGWDTETQATMEGMAKIDLVAGLLTLGFIVEYERDGDQWPLLGAVALTIANCSYCRL